MNTPPLPVDDSSWDVPAHQTAIYADKAHKYALVIPVINEGERIRGQLERIKQADLAIDVIVADGGSTDGSLDPDFVGPVGVRAVLTKTGPGKLSAQLRMAYAWALREGYQGIVTVDGNGKDGVEAVAHFIARLDAGCDYVQGSRYLAGGEALNTPLERTIANRLIHAPLLSLAGKHWFTDTTNGFRAYSARYLTHREVEPFRKEFGVYNLLFYLTVRAGQLGLKVDHVPVVRRYPQDGKVPTKIGGLASKLALLGETVRAATGGYTPDHAAKPFPRLGWPALLGAIVLLPLLLSVIVSPGYSPDSWALYELGQTVFGDFYRFTHFRSYASTSQYSAAFAPLWPSLIAVVDAMLGTGARTGLYLAFAAYFAFVLTSETIGRKIMGAPWVGAAAALALLLGPLMVWDELAAGRTIPLQLLLYAMVLRGLLAGGAMSLTGAAFVGFLSGLAVMNRFDAALLPLFAAGLVGWHTRSRLRAGLALAASCVALAPWFAYSLTTFGTLFASDNAGIAASLDPRAFVTDWWPEAQPAFSDAPGEWAVKGLANMGQWGWNSLSIVTSPLGAAVAIAMGALAMIRALAARAPGHEERVRRLWADQQILMGLAGVFLLMMVPQVVTGYLEYRYYTALVWVVVLGLGAWAMSWATSLVQRGTLALIFAALTVPWVLAFTAVTLVTAAGEGRLDTQRWAEFEDPRDVAQLRQCLGGDKEVRVLVLGDDLFAARAAALVGLRTMMEPRNMSEGRLGKRGQNAFIEAWEVDYVLVRDPLRLGDAQEAFGGQQMARCPLALFKTRAARARSLRED